MSQGEPHIIKPGGKAIVKSHDAASKVVLILSDGTEIKMNLGPGENVEVKLGTSSCTVNLHDLDNPSDGLKIIRD